ncbi:hypothetical protein SAMN02927921_03550, partial [Sinomicrobium oceani]
MPPPGNNGKNLILIRHDITVTVPQVAKQCTSVTFPSDEATDVPLIPEITWANVPGACGYKVSLGTNPDADNFLDGEDIGKVLSYTPEVPLQSSTTYHLRIIPYFEDEEQENCPVTSFSTGDGAEPPECTTLLSPVPGSTDVPVSTLLEWNSVNGADGYYLQAGTTPGGNDILSETDLTEGTMTSFEFPEALPENTEIFIRITPYNEEGEAEGCTEISFTTEILLTAPPCTTVNMPQNGDTEVGINTDISWNSIAEAEGYYVSIGTTSGGMDFVNRQQVSGNVFTLPQPLEEHTTYYVSVIPYNEEGEAEGCTEISFTTETLLTAPPCTT